RSEVKTERIVGLSKILQVLDGAEGMLVNGIAVIEIADDQGIDTAELRKNLDKKAEAMHGTKRGAGIVAAEDVTKHWPGDAGVALRKLGVGHDVSDGAL